MSDEHGSRDETGGPEQDTESGDRETLGYVEDTGDSDGERQRHDEDDKVIGTAPEAGEMAEPTTDSAQASREARWGLQQGLAVGLVSIASGLLVAFGLMQATGLVNLPEPLRGSAIAHWSIFVALGVVLLAAFAYSQRGT
ncbi:hypothetical protein C479_05758 [Halovivax asiaticus JCM 14624]|uniref:Uncharacterized protein n=1 Tax=Halovivax asiaticus JCM 14624 TaxID=1227490 RepID=M0BRF8_9EURY|nr:hypothetical protein [Halovivax asiaticus]ELZ12289.1 hypothetical protein C479_05758 [Halovivax asiaticus JCM 14624]